MVGIPLWYTLCTPLVYTTYGTPLGTPLVYTAHTPLGTPLGIHLSDRHNEARSTPLTGITRRVLSPNLRKDRHNEARTIPILWEKWAQRGAFYPALNVDNPATTRRVLSPFFGRNGHNEARFLFPDVWRMLTTLRKVVPSLR